MALSLPPHPPRRSRSRTRDRNRDQTRNRNRTLPALGAVTLAAGALSVTAAPSAAAPSPERAVVSQSPSGGVPATDVRSAAASIAADRSRTVAYGRLLETATGGAGEIASGGRLGGIGNTVGNATAARDNVKITKSARNGYIRSDGDPVTVIAHRGASSAAPENTLVAQEVARRAAADLIENDVQPSRDGVPFVLHDPTVDRTTDGTGAVRTLTSTRLKKLDAGSWFAPYYAGARLPTLAEQLADLRTRGGDLLLEIKGAHTRAQVAKIIKVIRAERMSGRVFVQSFDVSVLKYTYALAPELPLPLRSTLDADPVAVSRELHLTAYNPSHGALLARRGVVADLHGAGVAVMAWTAGSAATWKALEAVGVDAIITNRPAELAGWNAALGSRRS